MYPLRKTANSIVTPSVRLSLLVKAEISQRSDGFPPQNILSVPYVSVEVRPPRMEPMPAHRSRRRAVRPRQPDLVQRDAAR